MGPLAGSGNGELQWWKEWRTLIIKVGEDLARLICIYLGKNDFFLRGSLAYIFSGVLIWMQYLYLGGVWKKMRISRIPRGNKGDKKQQQ